MRETGYRPADDEDEDPFDEENPVAKEMMELMQQIASLAKSPNVRAMLMDLVSDIFEKD